MPSLRTAATDRRSASRAGWSNRTERAFDELVFVEDGRRSELEAGIGEIDRTVTESACGLTAPVSLVYDLAYQLAAGDLA